jgi:hypothetical protein
VIIQTVVETQNSLSDAKRLALTEQERTTIAAWIADHPDTGEVIEGTSGVRKGRFAGKGKGKSGGSRVMTFYSVVDISVFLLSLFAKNEKRDVPSKERKAWKEVLPHVGTDYQARSNKR